jgi:hypothetical protein
VIVCVPPLSPLGVYVTEQLEVVPEPTCASAQLSEPKLPEAEPFPKLTEPCGHDFVPESVSETVAVQVELWLIATEAGKQLTLVEVVRFVTVNAKPGCGTKIIRSKLELPFNSMFAPLRQPYPT